MASTRMDPEAARKLAASLLDPFRGLAEPGAFPCRVWELRPQEEGVPEELAALLPPEILRPLRRARRAVACVGDALGLDPRLVADADRLDLGKEDGELLSALLEEEGRVRVAELGPMGLRGHVGRVLGHARSAAKPKQEDAAAVLRALAVRSGGRRHPARAAVRRLLGELDGRLLAVQRRVRLLTGSAYNWLCADPERHAATLLSYPAFASVLTFMAAGALTFGGSLEDVLEEQGVERALARRLANRPLAPLLRARRLVGRPGKPPVAANGVVVTFFENGDPARAALRSEWMRLVPPHALPDGPDGWAALLNLVCTLADRDSSRHAWLADEAARELFAATLATDTWRSDFHPAACPDLALRLKDARDCFDHLLDDLVQPAAVLAGCDPHVALFPEGDGLSNHQIRSDAALRVAGRGGFRRLLAVSAEWHARVASGAAPRLGEGALTDDLPLPHVVRGPFAVGLPDGRTARVEPILDVGGLRAEGREMGHCIGGYAGCALRGLYVAFRIAVEGPGAGPVRITATLGCDPPDEDGEGPRAAARWSQHDMRLAGNGSPRTAIGPDGVAALWESLLALAVREAPRGPTSDADTRAARLMTEGLEALSSEPALLRAHAGAALRFWTPMLPKRLRADDPVAFVRRLLPSYVPRLEELSAAHRAKVAEEAARYAAIASGAASGATPDFFAAAAD